VAIDCLIKNTLICKTKCEIHGESVVRKCNESGRRLTSPKCNLDVAIQVCFGCQTTRFGVILPKPLRSIVIPRFGRKFIRPFCWHCCQPADRANVGAEPLSRLICGGKVGAPRRVLSVEVHRVRCV